MPSGTLVPAFAYFDWVRLAKDFAHRETEWLGSELDQAGIRHQAIDDGLASGNADLGALRQAWELALASEGRGRATLLAVYAYTRCQRAWELSVRHHDIESLLAALAHAWEEVVDGADADEGLAVGLMLEHAASLTACMRCENAVNCSCPVALAQGSAEVAQSCEAVLLRTSGLPREWAGFRAFLEGVLRAHKATFGALHSTSLAVFGWIVGDVEAERNLAAAVDRLRAEELSDDVRHDVYASELRAHRHTLETIRRRTVDRDVPSVTIDQAKLICCYPFAWRPHDGDTLAEVTRLLAAAPADLSVGRPQPCLVSDIWNPELYAISVLARPTLTVRTTAGMDLSGHLVEVRFSSLGTHHVRIERALEGASMHDVNQGLRRASIEMGREAITDPQGGGWERLPKYVSELVGDLRNLLGESEYLGGDREADLWAQFHVILEIRSASVHEPDGKVRPASKEDLARGAGGLLLQPIQPLAASLEEWTRLTSPDPVPTLLHDSGFTTDLVARTPNTSLFFMPGTPNWVLIGYEEMAEFTASLSPLLLRWKGQLEAEKASAVAKLAGLRPLIDERPTMRNRHRQPAMLQERAGTVDLEGLRIKLQTEVAEVRHDLGTLRSTALCRPSSNRIFLDRMYEAAGLTRLEAELDDLISELEALYSRAATFIGVLEERRKLRYDLQLQLIVAVLAVASLSGVVTLVNSVVVPASRLINPVVAGGEIATLVALSLLVILRWRQISRRMLR